MRQQGQQNRRNRSRSGRKTQNPLSRNYESNGPDVKIRGTASHIAEKYTALARDALSSGDTVVAENLFQHAEHYNRIIMSAQSTEGAVKPEANGAIPNGSAEITAEEVNSEDEQEKSTVKNDGEKKAEKSGRTRNNRGNGSSSNNRRRRRRSTNAKNGSDAKGNGSVGNGTSNDMPVPKQESSSHSDKPNEASDSTLH